MEKINNRIILSFILIFSSSLFSAQLTTQDYQIGESWSKETVPLVVDFSTVFGHSMALVGKINGGTAFYLGEYEGRFLIATNYHVCPSPERCVYDRHSLFGLSTIEFTRWNFPAGGRRAQIPITAWIGGWMSIDFAILEITPHLEEDRQFLRSLQPRFRFNHFPMKGEPLMLAGHGRAGNPERNLQVVYDEDCLVFSETGELRTLPDPDRAMTSDYKVHSFALGCDISHGDSGSPIFARNSGEIIGIIWTGRIPRGPIVQNRDYLQRIFESSDEAIWSELNLGVSMPAVRDLLSPLISTTASASGSLIDEKYYPALAAFLQI